MRKTKKCPKCDCVKLLDISYVPDAGDSSITAPAHAALRHEGYSFMGNEKKRSVGDVTAVMCSECGYLEYYCSNPKTVEPDGKFIHWLS